MPESSMVVRPEPPDSPTYSAAARLQAAGLPAAINLFTEAADRVTLPRLPQPVVIADYGSASGHNSLLPIGAAITALRSRIRKDHAIMVAHTDVPENDFTTLFQTLAADPDSYLQLDSVVFPAAVGRSFYQQVLPSYSVTLGWSSWAIHWLSRLPVPLGDHIVPAYSPDPQVRSACARQAAQDWHDFVAFRGRELGPEGRLVVLTMGTDASGAPGLAPLISALLDSLRELVGTGLITFTELADMAVPIVGRTEQEFRAPFAPKDRFEGLSVEHLEIFEAEDRFYHQYRLNDDAKTFGAQWASFTRAVIFDSLVNSLAEGGSDARAAEFCDRLERGAAERLAARPEAMTIPLALVVLVKHPRP